MRPVRAPRAALIPAQRQTLEHIVGVILRVAASAVDESVDPGPNVGMRSVGVQTRKRSRPCILTPCVARCLLP